MTILDQILVDLLVCRTTRDALASRHNCSSYEIRAICNRHIKDGLIFEEHLTDSIILYSITDAGRDRAATLQPQTTN